MGHGAPLVEAPEGIADELRALVGSDLLALIEAHDEMTLVVARESIERVMVKLRDEAQYQQLMEIAGVDYLDRPERFEVVYHLLSVTRNHRLRVKVSADEASPVPSVTAIWPVAGWLEREVYDMYGVIFSGNADLRRILTDYGFTGHPQPFDHGEFTLADLGGNHAQFARQQQAFAWRGRDDSLILAVGAACDGGRANGSRADGGKGGRGGSGGEKTAAIQGVWLCDHG